MKKIILTVLFILSPLLTPVKSFTGDYFIVTRSDGHKTLTNRSPQPNETILTHLHLLDATNDQIAATAHQNTSIAAQNANHDRTRAIQALASALQKIAESSCAVSEPNASIIVQSITRLQGGLK